MNIVFVLATVVLVAFTVAMAIDITLIDDVDGIQIVYRQLCIEDHDNLVANEYECEGLIAMLLVLVYPWAITVFIWVIYLSDRCTRRGFWKLRKGV